MASNADEVKRAAMAELARRELERRASNNRPSIGRDLARSSGLTARSVFNSVASIPNLIHDVPAEISNLATRTFYPEGYDVTINGQKQHRSGVVPYAAEQQNAALSQMGLPTPQTTMDKVADFGTQLITGAATGGLIDKMVLRGAGLTAPAASPRPAPTSQQLKELSRQAYQQAENAGVVISPESLAKSVGAIVGTAAKEGIDPTLHPQATAALKRLTDAVQDGQPIALQQLETLRKVAKGAAGSISADERRISRIIVDALDDYALNLKASDVIAGSADDAGRLLQQARGLWSRAAKSDTVEELIKRAGNRASQFSGSGYENALRTEFRNLIQNPRRLRLFTPVEQQALQRVARGGPIENVLRYFGKLAPTGVVSGAVSAGAGAAVGGVPGAVGLPLLGGAARQGATMLTSRNARLAAELMRRGGPAASTPLAQRLASQSPYALGATPTLYNFLFREDGR